MRNKGLKEADLCNICKEHGFPISQSAVNKILAYPDNPNKPEEFTSITLINFIQICKALKIDPGYILNLDADIELHSILDNSDMKNSKRQPLIYSMDEDEFNGYEGFFYCYFFPTISNETKFLQGELTFNKSTVGDYCVANFKLNTNKYHDIKEKNVFIKNIKVSLSFQFGWGLAIVCFTIPT